MKLRVRTRWIQNAPEVNPPTLARTVIASWFPGRYYLVSTIHCDGSSPLERLTQSLKTGASFNETLRGQQIFVSEVFRCDKEGVPKKRLLDRSYQDSEEALAGHAALVAEITATSAN